MKTKYRQPTREPPPGVRASWQKQNIQNQINQKTTKSEIEEMKKDRKKQEDRLLKRLSLRDRRHQVRLREQIASDPLFLVV